MIRLFRSLARDERGASIIEMAMVTPLLGSLLIGMVDISRAYSAKLQLEQSAYRAIEKVQGYQTTQSTYTFLATGFQKAQINYECNSKTANNK